MLSVEGIAVPAGGPDSQFAQQLRLRMEKARGPLRLTIQTGDARPRTVAVTRSMAHGDALYEGTGLTPVSLTRTSALVGLLAPVVLFFGAVLLFGRRRDPVAALLSISLLSLATGLSFSSLFWGHHLDAMWVVNVMAAIGSVGLLLAMQAFPNGRLVPRWTLYLMIATVVFRIVGTFLPEMSSIPFLVLVLLTLVAMIVRYRRDMPDARRQWRWAMIGFVTGMALLIVAVFGYTTYLDGHHGFGATAWSWIVTPLTLAVPLTIVVAGVVLSVLRYRLYDTQAAVSRSILLGVLTLTLLAIFTGSEKIVEVIGEEYFGDSMGALSGGLAAAFAAVAIAPLHHRLGHWVEHHFRKNLVHLRHDLPPLITELAETADPATVARSVLDHLAHGLHATRGAVIAKGTVLATRGIDASAIDPPGEEAAPMRVGAIEVRKRDPLFPVRVPLAADSGHWLLLGARPDDSLYDRQERDLLSDLAAPLAQASRMSADRAQRAAAAAAARLDRIERELQALRAGRDPAPSTT